MKVFKYPTAIEPPNIIENTIVATIFWRDNSFKKSFTVNTEIVLSRRESSLESSLYSSKRFALMVSPSSTETSLNGYAVNIPIKTDIKEVIMNTSTIVPSILPIFSGWLIFEIEVDIVRKIKGTIIKAIRFINMSPNGLNTVAFSAQHNPTIAPIIIAANKMSVCL